MIFFYQFCIIFTVSLTNLKFKKCIKNNLKIKNFIGMQVPVYSVHVYRVSHNTFVTLLFGFSRLLMQLGFSWSPLNSDFKTVLIFIPSIKIDQIST